MVIQRVDYVLFQGTTTNVGQPFSQTVSNLSQGDNLFDIGAVSPVGGSDYYLITLTVDGIDSNSRPPGSGSSGAPFLII